MCLFELAIIAGLGFLVLNHRAPEHALEQPEPVVVQPATSTILFVGDMMFDRYVKRAITQAQDPLLPFSQIASVIQDADLAFGNLEGPISDRGTKQGSEFSFRFESVGTVNALTYAGFDIVNLANNHIWDYGRDAVLDTMKYLRDAGISYIGFGRDSMEAGTPVIKKIGDTTVAFLGYTEFYSSAAWAGQNNLGLSSLEPGKIVRQIKELKEANKADVVVVSMHWGAEYETHSNEYQKNLAHQFVDAGADLIVGHHPHVAQEIEQYKHAWIAYSLGNFVFDQNFSADTRHGLMLKVVLYQSGVQSVDPIDIKFTNEYQPYILKP